MASDRARYQPNRREMRRLMQSAEIAKLCEQAAENAKKYAEGIAPRETGTYAASFEVETRIVGDRQTAVLMNTVKYANVLEQKHRVLGRAVDHAKP
jgi:hypothetical protein